MTAKVLVTGGAGYIGSVLAPKLSAHADVTIVDALWFEGANRRFLDALDATVIRGDLRDESVVNADFLRGFDTVIHLAAVSNDPCSDIDPSLTRSINLDATARLMRQAKRAGVRKFIFASSASVYGVKDDPDVTEELPLEPITLYARYKAEAEQVLNALVDDRFLGISVRAATVCGYSPRLRLDLTINILTFQALTQRKITVFGGSQMRPNIHIEDLTDLYVRLATSDAGLINGRAYNVSRSNATVLQLAETVRDEIDHAIPIVVTPTSDLRSYQLSAELIRRELGYVPKRELVDAVRDLRSAYASGMVPDPSAAIYRNIDVMKSDPQRVQLAGAAR
jgi:nucleoside-diphosphate-sugar epimerase